MGLSTLHLCTYILCIFYANTVPIISMQIRFPRSASPYSATQHLDTRCCTAFRQEQDWRPAVAPDCTAAGGCWRTTLHAVVIQHILQSMCGTAVAGTADQQHVHHHRQRCTRLQVIVRLLPTMTVCSTFLHQRSSANCLLSKQSGWSVPFAKNFLLCNLQQSLSYSEIECMLQS